MATETGLFPIDPAKLVGGAAMVLVAEVFDESGNVAVPVPDRLEDFVDPFYPDYTIKEPWFALGAAREGQGTQYGREIQATDWKVEQRQQAVSVEITDTPRTMLLQIAEVTPRHIQILEEGFDIETLSGSPSGQASGYTPQERVRAGAIDFLTKYRIVMLGLRLAGEGEDVIEHGTTTHTRGCFVATILHRGSLARENVTYELQKGQMANIPVNFTSFPDPDMDRGQETVTWLFEQPGDIYVGS